MKNWEKCEETIKEFTKKYKSFGLVGTQLRQCSDEICECCKFNRQLSSCLYQKFNWLYEEVAPTITHKEKIFCEIFDNDSRCETYITRDVGGRLELWADEPINCDGYWSEADAGIRLDPSYFSFISYKDEKAWSIADLLELEVE